MKTNGTPILKWMVAMLMFAAMTASRAQTNNVTGGNNSSFTINGQLDPSFTLQRGVTYVFKLSNVSFHPFWIKTNTGSGGLGAFLSGVVNNGANSGEVVFTVPANAPNSMLYQCGNHSPMTGELTIVTPAAPPTVKIVHINVGPFVTMKSTGTNGNGWSVIPELNCGLTTTNWSAISPFTNTFSSGTNTTTFPRLEAICGSSNVFVRIRNQLN